MGYKNSKEFDALQKLIDANKPADSNTEAESKGKQLLDTFAYAEEEQKRKDKLKRIFGGS